MYQRHLVKIKSTTTLVNEYSYGIAYLYVIIIINSITYIIPMHDSP